MSNPYFVSDPGMGLLSHRGSSAAKNNNKEAERLGDDQRDLVDMLFMGALEGEERQAVLMLIRKSPSASEYYGKLTAASERWQQEDAARQLTEWRHEKLPKLGNRNQ